jgi:hypothetical protein
MTTNNSSNSYLFSTHIFFNAGVTTASAAGIIGWPKAVVVVVAFWAKITFKGVGLLIVPAINFPTRPTTINLFAMLRVVGGWFGAAMGFTVGLKYNKIVLKINPKSK